MLILLSGLNITDDEMSLYRQSTMPLRNLLIAWLLCVQFGCVLVEAFAASVPADTADPHHSYSLVVQILTSEHASQQLAPGQTDSAVAAEHAKHGCDHCNHCHASHLGLFNVPTALTISAELQLTGYINQPPTSPQANIYRPPIA